MDLVVSTVVLSANGKPVDNHPRDILLTLSAPLCAWVVFVGGFVEAAIFFVETAIRQKLVAKVSREHLCVLEGHFNYEFVWKIVGRLIGAVVSDEQVHGGFER
jgi:hypothetical protein